MSELPPRWGDLRNGVAQAFKWTLRQIVGKRSCPNNGPVKGVEKR